METTKFKVQLITQEGKWPYVANGYTNRNGTVSIEIDPGVTLTGGQRLYVRPARVIEKPVDEPAEAAQ